jgi:hypothetical protein
MANSTNIFPRARTVFVALVVVPALVVGGIWIWIRSERAKVRERGVAACVREGHAAAECERGADANHERCVELTFRPASRMSAASFDEAGYVECITIGDKAYWEKSAHQQR